ncbi:MAG: patatin-like phospholipase family protein [Chitinophagaceae bacterium]|nr:patatin-like phospholipase family protein [Chitinophagaceae bacterium]
MLVAEKKESEKSSAIAAELSALDMFSFVDGKSDNGRFTKWIKKLIQRIILKPKSLSRFVSFLKWTLIALLLTSVACFIFNFIKPGIAKWLGLSAGVLLILIISFGVFLLLRFKRIAKSGYGLNSGNTFHSWLKSILNRCHVQQDPARGPINSLAAFGEHFMQVPELKVRPDYRRPDQHPPHMPMMTLITCDIISKIKIEFPRMWDLYWDKEENVHPADFVRASMSIPVFFESFRVDGIRQKSRFEIWSRQVNWQNANKLIPDSSQFIDGGILSNFPISIFYNPGYAVPRMPTFGVRLQDGIIDAANRSNNTLSKYLMSLFSTIRFHFDRDFIIRNRAFNKAVCSIDVRGHSWLNFFMTDEEKQALFRKGAEAAISFLRRFDWEAYKTERAANEEWATEQFENPNNLEAFPFSSVQPGSSGPA